jgi:hypothetical protein
MAFVFSLTLDQAEHYSSPILSFWMMAASTPWRRNLPLLCGGFGPERGGRPTRIRSISPPTRPNSRTLRRRKHSRRCTPSRHRKNNPHCRRCSSSPHPTSLIQSIDAALKSSSPPIAAPSQSTDLDVLHQVRSASMMFIFIWFVLAGA